MSAIRDHRKRISEHLEEIEGAILTGIERRPATIGLHVSACSMEIFELFLHKEGKIPIGKVIKHDWFKRPFAGQKIEPLAERKLKVDFEGKEQIFELLYTIEENRTSLVYGRATKTQIEAVLTAFDKLKELLMGRIGEDNE